jgi:tripartite-type tricarboxylate transporter receptor subunit TctC
VIIDRLHAEMMKIMAMPDIKQKILELGLIPNDTPSTEGMWAYVKSEHEKWGAPVKQLGLEGSQ